jgi:glycosyltransferase 2 family protein
VKRVPQSRSARAALLLGVLAIVVAVLWWRGPNWSLVADVFGAVTWRWIVLALVLNLLSVVVRALAWRTVVAQALPDERVPFTRTFSAFCVGLLANAVLPARTGELARVAVLTRRLPRGRGYTATLLGTVFTHRVFDVPAVLLLVVYVLLTAKIPHWAITTLVIAAGVGVVLLGAALLGSRLRRPVLDGMHPARRVFAMARLGLAVLRSPVAAAVAIFFQCVGWTLQLLAVYTSMRGFGIDAPLSAAALVLLLMNVALIFPLWPGNVGLLQAAVALPLRQYGVAYARGFAYGIGLQVIEMSVGVGVGLLFLAREGLSFAMLKRIEQTEEDEARELIDEAERPAVSHGQAVRS